MTDQKIIQENGIVVKTVPMGTDCRKITLDSPEAFAEARPGQFVTLAIAGMDTPLLRRPFSIHSISGIKEGRCLVDILFKVVGIFTKNLSEIKNQGRVNILGPLGHGFTWPKKSRTEKSGPVVIIGGGIGVAPLLFLAQSLRQQRPVHENSRVFIGGRTTSDILCADDFTRLGYKVIISTDDGTRGEKGMITTPFHARLSDSRPETIYACGPMPMLKAVFETAAEHKVPCQVSVETVMACGLGVCLGCAVKTSSDDIKFRHVCKDGPVFDASELWMAS
ncbi:MAG: dihydroorotate dehydrogenase electron transfer subunit [Deltaproteobacteria bacterium]|nr:dihydroorotate dehydrogenase electron transfer subunit [Deltaproteobacteria bacterium]